MPCIAHLVCRRFNWYAITALILKKSLDFLQYQDLKSQIILITERNCFTGYNWGCLSLNLFSSEGNIECLHTMVHPFVINKLANVFGIGHLNWSSCYQHCIILAMQSLQKICFEMYKFTVNKGQCRWTIIDSLFETKFNVPWEFLIKGRH